MGRLEQRRHRFAPADFVGIVVDGEELDDTEEPAPDQEGAARRAEERRAELKKRLKRRGKKT